MDKIKVVTNAPLKLPKLKKVKNTSNEIPKLELPKLKLPKLNPVEL